MKKTIKKMAWTTTFGMAYMFFCVAFIFLAWQLLFLQTAQKTKGIVIEMDRQPKIRSHDQFAPIIEFETESKEKINLHTKVYDYPPNFKKGDEVIVFYRASNPQNAKIQHFRHLWFWTAIWAGIGLLFLIVGFLSPNARGF
jgi:hypothetical protein